MHDRSLKYFPFPHIYEGKKRDGILAQLPERCISCRSDTCLKDSESSLKLCSFGFNYQVIDKSLVVCGVIISNFDKQSKARSKLIKSKEYQQYTKKNLSNAVRAYQAEKQHGIEELRKAKDEIISKYKENNVYKAEFLEELRPLIKKAFSTLHDYRQLASQVSQNINVILRNRYGGDSVEQQLESAEHPERAIYWLSKMMDEKLKTAFLVMNPETIGNKSNLKKYHIHKLMLKYIRIYQMSFDEKNVQVMVTGESIGRALGNTQTVGVIPHTLIDNAYKYSPRKSIVKIQFQENDEQIAVSISSYGPKIYERERKTIFDPFVRGREAQKDSTEGTGFGLYLARLIGNENNIKLSFEQQKQNRYDNKYYTTFTMIFNRDD